ncbi:MAG: HAMP domain-containing protein [Pirellulales bacterium]|nr:HAMP domain-containing protein [Pirellulales bacterium]
MSYRSIKRVLGETSLERKCHLLFGVCLLLLISASFWWYGNRTNKIIDEQNPNTGRWLVDQAMYAQHWTAWQQQDDPQYVLVVQALATAFGKQPYKLKYIVPKPYVLNEEDREAYSPRNADEEEILKRFLTEKPDDPLNAREYAEQYSPDGNYYYYYQPIRATIDSCFLGCHQPMSKTTGDLLLSGSAFGKSTAEAVGDLMAVAKLTLSTEATRKSININQGIFIATAIVTVFLAVVASYFIVRYVIVKPLRHLREVSDAVGEGNTSLRAEIHTGDEFEDLAMAFNRMLRHLTTAQEELRRANVSLDGKVDELAQANMRLYELNMLKSDFLATMSHELRTPLNSILGFSEVLGSIDALDEKQKRYVQNIQKSGRTLLEMINDILDLAKIESGKMDVRLSDFRVAHLVAAQCDMARPLAERKNIDLEYRIQPDLPPMHQDQARVQQILNNLLSNAIKFTPEGGRVMVSVRRDEQDFLVLKVSDTGVGIAPEDQQTIFEKFRQGRTALPDGDAMTREHPGSGLGLSIVKELCRLLRGEVLLKSELGTGSDFIVRLPWTLDEQPRIDAAIAAGYEQFAKQRLDAEPTT